MSARPITELYQRPCPSFGVVLGKGPSLDRYDATANPPDTYVMGLNEVPLVIRCDGATFSDDSLRKAPLDILNPGIDLFRQVYNGTTHGGRGYAYICETKPKGYGSEWQIPCNGPATACRAITILAMWGIRRMALWGFDAMRQLDDVYDENEPHYAACLDAVLRGGVNRNYRRISQGIRDTLAFHGVEVTYGQLCDNGAA